MARWEGSRGDLAGEDQVINTVAIVDFNFQPIGLDVLDIWELVPDGPDVAPPGFLELRVQPLPHPAHDQLGEASRPGGEGG